MRRHPELERWVGHLEAMIAGQRQGWSLPGFAWVQGSRCQFGRKGLDEHAAPMLMPARLDFGQEHHAHRPTATVRGSMSAPGLHVEVEYDSSTGMLREIDGDLEPIPVGLPVLGDPVQAQNGRWWVLSQAERMLVPALHRAHTHLSITLARQLNQPQRRWISHSELTEQLATQIWLSPAVQEGLPRALSAQTMKADPIRVTAMLVRREAHKGLHRHLDDPKQGAVIRSIASELGTFDVEAIVAEYRRRQRGGSRIGAMAALRALTLEPTIQARSQPESRH